MNKKLILVELPKNLIDFLLTEAETGMGYHVVNVTFKNGKKLYNRVVIDSRFLLLEENEEVDSKEIEKLKVVRKNDKFIK